MPGARSDPSQAPDSNPVVVFGVLALAFALRLIHFSSALHSPLSFQPGPDEDYYLRFGEAVASGRGADTPEFTFMDPGYGYLLGVVFKLIGVNPVAVYLLQVLLDTATVYGMLVIGRLLGRPRAGLCGALLYGLTSTAVMFCTALLKEVWVASYVTWWVAAALALLRSERRLGWIFFGVYCGLGIALRSTLLLFAPAALLLPALRPRTDGAERSPAAWASRSLLVAVGLAVSLLPWSARNHRAFDSLSPLPHNGGIVLHQVYNAENARSVIWIPPFVSYLHPSEIWRGYSAEAQRRSGRPLTPREVDAYWRREALEFMRRQPATVLADVARKSEAFLADTEIPNNRSSAEERLFSPVLKMLPPPMAWLLAMGLAGLVWLAREERRWAVIAVPIAISWFTVAMFWAEDRFRFHAVPLLALSSGVWIDGLLRHLPARRFPEPGHSAEKRRQIAAFGLLAVAIGAASLILGRQFPPPAIRWDHVVWGYIKMGNAAEARVLAERVSLEQPDNEPVWEALGYLAAGRQEYSDAVLDYQRAIALRPRSYLAHYNLAKAFLALERRPEAAGEARIAMSLDPSEETRALLERAQSPAPQ